MPDTRERSETLQKDAAQDKESRAQANPASQRIAQYDLQREIGRGGMSVVYVARDRKTGREVALKVLTLPGSLSPAEAANLAARFERGARAAASLRHPNSVSLLEVGASQGYHFVAMEYLRGQTLRARMNARKLTLREVCLILSQVAGALDAAHHAGRVHRDIKPTNIMILPNGTLKLLDSGIAPSSSETTLTNAGIITGSPSCMAPEQVNGEPETAATDIWTLGVLSYEMLTGRLPFPAQTAEDVLNRVLHQPPALTPDLSEAVQRVLQRALEKDPSLRYPTAGAFVQALSTALNPPVSAIPKPAVQNFAAPKVAPDLNPAPDLEPDSAQGETPSVQLPAPLRRWLPGMALALLFAAGFWSAFAARQHASRAVQQEAVAHAAIAHAALPKTAAIVSPPFVSPQPVPPPAFQPAQPFRGMAQPSRVPVVKPVPLLTRPRTAQIAPVRHPAEPVREAALPRVPGTAAREASADKVPARQAPGHAQPLPQADPRPVAVPPALHAPAAVPPTRPPLAAVVVKRLVRPGIVRPVVAKTAHAAAVQPIAAQMAARRAAAHPVITPVSVKTVDRGEPLQSTAPGFTLPSDSAGYDPEAEARQRKSAWSQSGSTSGP